MTLSNIATTKFYNSAKEMKMADEIYQGNDLPAQLY